MHSNVVVLLEDVWKEYKAAPNSIIALRGVSMQVLEHQYVCVTGPNGSGKSTLLKIIAGILRPDKGRVRVLGKDPFSELEVRSLIGLMPQEDILFDTLSIREHIELLSYISRGLDQNYVAELITKYGLIDLLDRKPYQLSGGQRRLVQLVLVLARKPRILLLDEPTAFLDAENTSIVLDFIHRLHCDEKLTIIISTHDELVCSNASRIIHIRGGLIIE